MRILKGVLGAPLNALHKMNGFVALIQSGARPRGTDVMPRSKTTRAKSQKALRSANKRYPDFPLKQSPLCSPDADWRRQVSKN